MIIKIFFSTFKNFVEFLQCSLVTSSKKSINIIYNLMKDLVYERFCIFEKKYKYYNIICLMKINPDQHDTCAKFNYDHKWLT